MFIPCYFLKNPHHANAPKIFVRLIYRLQRFPESGQRSPSFLKFSSTIPGWGRRKTAQNKLIILGRMLKLINIATHVIPYPSLAGFRLFPQRCQPSRNKYHAVGIFMVSILNDESLTAKKKNNITSLLTLRRSSCFHGDFNSFKKSITCRLKNVKESSDRFINFDGHFNRH